MFPVTMICLIRSSGTWVKPVTTPLCNKTKRGCNSSQNVIVAAWVKYVSEQFKAEKKNTSTFYARSDFFLFGYIGLQLATAFKLRDKKNGFYGKIVSPCIRPLGGASIFFITSPYYFSALFLCGNSFLWCRCEN